jgi:hypothetical protein
VTVLLVVATGVFVLGLADHAPDEAPQLFVDAADSNAGLVITPNVIDHQVKVVINGVEVTTIGPTDKRNSIWPDQPESILTSTDLQTGNTHIAVGTYDGDSMDLPRWNIRRLAIPRAR